MKIDLEKIKQGKSLKELLEFGILNIDKPSGPTSFVTGEIIGRRILKSFNVRKFSHAGTLDPAVTGVLPIMLNRACKLLGWFMKKKKTYVGVMKIHKEISEEELRKEMDEFEGKIMQLPPVKSRVKREIREREVYSWKILEYDKEKKEALFEAEVEAGTYIRKLISDLGEKIGGAHMTELRRTKAGIFSEGDKNFVNLYDLEKAVKEAEEGREEKLRELLIPGEIIGEILPVVQLKDKEKIKQLLTGKPIMKNDVDKVDNDEFVLFFDNRLIGVYKKVDEHDIIARSEFVLN